jgi:hypothetical protein
MRMLMNVVIPNAKFNAAVKAGTVGQSIGRIVEATKPEAVYFTEQDGRRGCIMIVEVSEPSRIPALAEPWFLHFDADVKFRIVMSPEDLKKSGIDEIGKKWG